MYRSDVSLYTNLPAQKSNHSIDKSRWAYLPTKQAYDEAFKIQAVKLGREIPFSKAAKELGINIDIPKVNSGLSGVLW